MPNGQPHKQPNFLFLPLCTVNLSSVFCEYCSVSNFDAESWLDALAPVKLACNVWRRSPDQTTCWFSHTSSAGGWTHFSLTASPVTRIIHYRAEFIICVCMRARTLARRRLMRRKFACLTRFRYWLFPCVYRLTTHTPQCAALLFRA